jgi:hypothetical protein
LGAVVSLIGQTGHSEDSHSPDAWASTVVRRMILASLSIAVVWTVAISWLPSASHPGLASTGSVRRSAEGGGEPHPTSKTERAQERIMRRVAVYNYTFCTL